MQQLIPLEFYAIASSIYAIAFLVNMLVALKAFRAFTLLKNKRMLTLCVGFSFLSISFLGTLFASSLTFLKSYVPSLGMSINLVNFQGFNFYYTLSTIAYLFLALTYTEIPEWVRKLKFVFFVPLWYANNEVFHWLSLVLLSYVVLQNFLSWIKRRRFLQTNTILAFVMLLLYHLMLVLTKFSIVSYLLAHIFLLAGSLLLAYNLSQVFKDEKK